MFSKLNSVDTLSWPVIAVISLGLLVGLTFDKGLAAAIRISLIVALPWVLARAITKRDLPSILASVSLLVACVVLQVWWALILAGAVIGVQCAVGLVFYAMGRIFLASYPDKNKRP